MVGVGQGAYVALPEVERCLQPGHTSFIACIMDVVPQLQWNRNLSALFTAVANPSPLFALAPARLLFPESVGVGHSFAGPLTSSVRFAPLDRRPEHARGVLIKGKDEQSLAAMRRSLLFRAEHVPFRIEPCAGQVFEHFAQTGRDVPSDVLKESKRGLALHEHAQKLRPKVPGVLRTLAPASDGERLTRVASNDAIHDSSPRATIEDSQVGVDRSAIKQPFFHSRTQTRRDIGPPLHVSDDSSPTGQSESELDPSNPGT